MIKNCILAGGIAVLCAGVAASAQSTSGQDDQTGSSSSSQSAQSYSSSEATTTITGCVYREQDIPGRSPNVAERAGVMEDYILAEVKESDSSSSESSSSESATGATATGTSGTSAQMYKLEHASDEQLSSFVGKRVQVTGKIDREAGDQPSSTGTSGTTADNSPGPDRIELPEFEVSSITAASGSCPATPSSAK